MSKLLDKLFGSRTRAKLLGWFFAHSGESYSVRQLASILGDDPSNLSKELSKLEDLGILISSRERNLKRFQVNQECAFGPELKGLMQKTTGIMGRLRSVLQAAKGIDFAFVYGSFAKGTENAESDIDLLIVGDIDLDKLDRIFIGLEKSFGQLITFSLTSASMRPRKPRATPSFMKYGVGTRSGLSEKTMDLKRLETLGLIDKIDPNHKRPGVCRRDR